MKRRDPHTRDLFAAPESVAVTFGEGVVGRGDFSSQIARIISRTLADAREEKGLTRETVAAALSEKLGRDVSKDTLDKWASEATDDRRIPVDAFAVLIGVTGGYEALGWIPGLYDFAVVESRYLDIIQLAQIEDHERTLAARKANIKARMRAQS